MSEQDEQNEIQELQEEFNLQILEKIGMGAFASVYKVLDIETKNIYAVKVMPKTQDNDYSEIECQILSQLNHPNIVQFEQIIQLKKTIYLIMEYLPGGSLQQFIENKKAQGKEFSQEEIRVIMRSLLGAVQQMHDNDIIHRDIQLENILLQDVSNLSTIKVVDFGLSTRFDRDIPYSLFTQQCGTVIYMAPEQLNGLQYSKPVDIWSVGICMYQLFTMGKHPFYIGGQNKDILKQKINNLKWVFPDNMTELAKDLFLRLMKILPTERYVASDGIQHPWVTGNLDETIPVTFLETSMMFDQQEKLLRLIKGMMILNLVKQKAMHSNQFLNASPNRILPNPVIRRQEWKAQTEEDQLIEYRSQNEQKSSSIHTSSNNSMNNYDSNFRTSSSHRRYPSNSGNQNGITYKNTQSPIIKSAGIPQNVASQPNFNLNNSSTNYGGSGVVGSSMNSSRFSVTTNNQLVLNFIHQDQGGSGSNTNSPILNRNQTNQFNYYDDQLSQDNSPTLNGKNNFNNKPKQSPTPVIKIQQIPNPNHTNTNNSGNNQIGSVSPTKIYKI